MLSSTSYNVDGLLEAQEFYHTRGWTDGLPVIPPTEEAVNACLQSNGLPASHLIGIEPVRNRALTAEKIAINAVMAGCLPMHFPVIITALGAMLEERILVSHGATKMMINLGELCDIQMVPVNGSVNVKKLVNASHRSVSMRSQAVDRAQYVSIGTGYTAMCTY